LFTMTDPLTEPLFTVVRGQVSADELAALTVVLLARTGCGELAASGPTSGHGSARWPQVHRPAFRPPHSWQANLQLPRAA
jgi:hypothetical protein